MTAFPERQELVEVGGEPRRPRDHHGDLALAGQTPSRGVRARGILEEMRGFTQEREQPCKAEADQQLSTQASWRYAL